MSNDSTAVDFGINLLEEEIDDVIFRTNEFLTDATFTGGQGPFWWILQMSMALAGLFAIIHQYCPLLVVPTFGHRHSRWPQHLVRFGLPELYT